MRARASYPFSFRLGYNKQENNDGHTFNLTEGTRGGTQTCFCSNYTMLRTEYPQTVRLSAIRLSAPSLTYPLLRKLTQTT